VTREWTNSSRSLRWWRWSMCEPFDLEKSV
jgi:hypothetical protein